MRRLFPAPLALLLLTWASPAFAGAPTATGASASVAEDGVSSFALRASDPDRDALTYELVSAPAHGTVSIAGRNAQYIPAANYNGPDSYTFRARDTGGLYSNVATMTYAVTAVNDPPTAAAGSLTISEDGSGSISLGGTDIDSATVTYSIVLNSAAGSVSLNASSGLAVFTPLANWSGTTTFRYQVSDGAATASGTITVTVLPVNDVPVANVTSATLNEDAGAIFTVTATDADNEALTYAIATPPSHGAAVLGNHTITYTPTANYNGPDSLTFVASDAASTSAPATVTLTISPVNDAPTTSGTSVTTSEDVPATVALTGSDVDGDPLTWVIDTGALGSATVNSTTGIATFTPTANASGAGQFSFHVTDGLVNSLGASVAVTIVPVDDTPVATALALTVNEDAPQTDLLLIGTDPDSPSLTYALGTLPAHGSLTLLGRTARYTPATGYSGSDSFTYTVSDGAHTSTPGTVAITVTPVNDPPMARNTAAMTGGGPILVYPMASDQEGGLSAPALWTLPTHGTVTLDGDHFVYAPDSGYVGRDRFSWVVDDGAATTEGQVYISVTPPWGGATSNLSQVGLNNIHFYEGQVGADPGTAPVDAQAPYILGDLTDLGVETMRQLSVADLTWGAFEPFDGYFFYEDPNAVLAETELEPRYTLFSTQYASPTPPWATEPAEFQKVMGPEAYDYLDAALTEYGADVRYWELGNEMFHWVAANPPATVESIASLPPSYPVDGYTPEEQADFLAEAAAYIRARDPDAIIVLPSVIAADPMTDEWLERVVAHAGSDWFDVVSYHSYAEWTVARADRPHLEVEMNALGLDDKLVQLTETGSTSDPLNTTRTDYPNSETTQAADVFRRMLPGWAAGDSTTIWHTYRDHYDNAEAGLRGCGLFEADGSEKPAAWAMMLMNTELLPFTQVTDVSEAGLGYYAYEVRRADGGARWVAWGTGTWTVPAGMTERTTVMPTAAGEYTWSPVTPGDTLTLTDTPILTR